MNFADRQPDIVVDELPSPIHEREPGVLPHWTFEDEQSLARRRSARWRHNQHPMEEIRRTNGILFITNYFVKSFQDDLIMMR